MKWVFEKEAMKDRQPTSFEAERWAAQALAQLPERRAPASLAPRILAAIARAEARPWHRRPWSEWPEPMRWMTILALGAALAALAQALTGVQQVTQPVLSGVDAQVAATLKPASVLVSAGDAVGRSLWRAAQSALGSYAMAAVAGFLLVLWAAVVGFGATCWRLAEHRVSLEFQS